MRVTPWLAVILVGFLLAFLIKQTDDRGAALRAQERGGSQTVLEIMQAQEQRRLQLGDPAPAGTRAPLYVELGELLASGAVKNLQRVDDPSGRDLFLRDGYLIQLVLQDEYGVAASDDGESITGSPIGQRYVVWAWPAEANNVFQVLYFGSNAGFLIQCENGTIAGSRAAAPFEKNPLGELEDEDQFRAIRRHFCLADIRGDPQDWAEWLRGSELQN